MTVYIPQHPSQARRHGFTLIEACVIVAAIAIVVAVVYPMFARDRQARERAGCHSTLQYSIGLALMQYIQDSDETFPKTRGSARVGSPFIASWRTALVPYQRVSFPAVNGLWRCTSNHDNTVISDDGLPVSYDVNDAGVIRQDKTIRIAQVESPSQVIEVFEENGDSLQARQVGVPWDHDTGEAGWTNILFNGHFGGATYLFVDGHVKSISPPFTISSCNMWHLNIRDPVSPRAREKLRAAQQNFAP